MGTAEGNLADRISVSRCAVTVAVMIASYMIGAGCEPGVIEADVNVDAPVQPGAITVPIQSAAVETDVPIFAPIFAPMRLDRLVDVDSDIDVGLAPETNLGLLALSRGDERVVTSQPAETTAQADQTAGRDARQTTTTVNVSGSAWPIVATVALMVGMVLGVLYLRTMIRARDDKLSADRLEGNAKAVARAISDLPPDSGRDALLMMIKARLPDCDGWDKLVDESGLRVSRSKDAASC